MELGQGAQAGGVGLLGSALVLGIRHGIDWDHIAAIADITSTTTNVESADAAVGARRARFGALEARAVWLASLYALGHATVVAALGALALYFQALLPEWIDPIMERVVGLTLVALGLWVFYSLFLYWRGEGDFKLRSRWMLVFAAARHGLHRLQHRVGGHAHDARPFQVDQYGPRAAFSVGLLHGIGAETGSQVLIIAAVGGAASQGLGTGMMLAFILGLLISNSLIAVLTATGFISSTRARSVYVAIGAIAGAFSLVIGLYFLLGASGDLPSLEPMTALIGGEAD